MKPMLAKPSTSPFDRAVLDAVHDDSVVLDVKIDGKRLLVDLSPAAGPRAWQRDGDPTPMPGPLAELLGRGRADVLLDGEVVGDTFWVFDYLRHDDLAEPLRKRRERLDRFLTRWAPPADLVRPVPSAAGVADKARLAQRVLTEGLEGLVSKRLDSIYLPGKRSGSWRKLKHVKEADFVVTRLAVDGKDNMALGLWAGGETPLVVGESSALTGDGPKVKQIVAAAGRGPDEDIADLGIVVTVTYLYVGANGRLVQPVTPRLRTDKRPEECTYDQLHLTRSPA